ncbi:hypothetical protein CFAM422_011505 [Trichoderma lentiforme]|uniref:Uncharacterized protein n=1 Tax=Trichoderma lentiforme TaxID=1567552 RepID=A0A9P5C8N2_9HYPO|nr:hypothetical protein CFAM422_011505 [Trichoderma lentiforme]
MRAPGGQTESQFLVDCRRYGFASRAELEQKPKCKHDVSRRGAWLASRLAVAEIIGAAAPAGDSAQG